MRSCDSIMGFVGRRSFANSLSREGLNSRAIPRFQPGPSAWDGHSQRRLTMFDAIAFASHGRLRPVTALLVISA